MVRANIEVVVVVDPWSTGETLATEFLNIGKVVVAVWTSVEFESNTGRYFANIVGDNVDLVVAYINSLQVLVTVVVPGAETGVILADELSVQYHTRMNPFELSTARRNKYIMGETIRAAGVRAVQQTIATEWNQVNSFLESWNPSPFQVIVKPNQSAGSDDVFLCTNELQVKTAFEKINGCINHLGCVNEGVLIQEYLQGTEFVIDTISKDGEHKVCAIWQYDKRSANDQFNVYFGMKPLAVTGDQERALVEYIFAVLDALKFENGPGHGEVKMTPSGPVLVEIGARCHGGGGVWQILAQKAFGMDQITATALLYSDPSSFDKLANFPADIVQHCIFCDLVSYEEGIIEDIPGEKALKNLASCHNIIFDVQRGQNLRFTKDMFSSPGQVQLVHNSAEQVESDYKLIHELLRSGFFTLKSEKQTLATQEPQDE